MSSESKVEVTWEMVFDSLEGISDDDKHDYLKRIGELTIELFLANPMYLREHAVEEWGMVGWAQEITDTIEVVMPMFVCRCLVHV